MLVYQALLNNYRKEKGMKKGFISEQNAEGYVDVCITLLIIISFIASIMFLYPIFTVKQDLNQSVKHITRTIELTGKADDTTINAIFDDGTLIKPDEVDVITPYEDLSEKTIQLKSSFTVVAKKTIQIPIIKPFIIDPVYITIEISSTGKGVSEVYWK